LALFAGGGVRGRRVIGSTDELGRETLDPGWSQRRDIRAEDIEATIYSALGIDWTTTRRDDPLGHLREHSIEVQLPFLQFMFPEVRFVPICMGFQDLEAVLRDDDRHQEIVNGEPSPLKRLKANESSFLRTLAPRLDRGILHLKRHMRHHLSDG
jgi:hypothetical protein